MPTNKIPEPGTQEVFDCIGLKCCTKEETVIDYNE
jgi:hypothetical protein